MDVVEHMDSGAKLEFCITWYYLTGMVLSAESIQSYWLRNGGLSRQAG